MKYADVFDQYAFYDPKEMLETENKVEPAAVGVAVVVSGVLGTRAAALPSLSDVGIIGQVAIGGMISGASLQGCSACHSSR